MYPQNRSVQIIDLPRLVTLHESKAVKNDAVVFPSSPSSDEAVAGRLSRHRERGFGSRPRLALQLSRRQFLYRLHHDALLRGAQILSANLHRQVLGHRHPETRSFPLVVVVVVVVVLLFLLLLLLLLLLGRNESIFSGGEKRSHQARVRLESGKRAKSS